MYITCETTIQYDPNKSFNRWIAQQEHLVETMVQVEAIIRILEKKGITDQEELLEDVKKIRMDLGNSIRRKSWEN